MPYRFDYQADGEGRALCPVGSMTDAIEFYRWMKTHGFNPVVTTANGSPVDFLDR